MRPLFPGDMDHAVRVLLATDESARGRRAAEILHRADIADRYRKRLGRAHPDFGTGSVLSATGGMAKADLPDRCDKRYCEALPSFLTAYLGRFGPPEVWPKTGGT